MALTKTPGPPPGQGLSAARTQARAEAGPGGRVTCVLELNEYEVYCPKCNARAIAESITRTTENAIPWDDCYVVVQCKICQEYMLIFHPKDEEKSYRYRRGAKMLWPISSREMSPTIPESLRLEHKEARSCFKNAAYTATVVMVRRTLLGIWRQEYSTNQGA